MILQALAAYYEQLIRKGLLDKPGWQQIRVSFALRIDRAGKLIGIVPLQCEEERGKKKVLVPQQLSMPAQAKKTSGIEANFLCDNATYFLGIDSKGKPERARRCFDACREKHHQILDGLSCETAKALLAFLDSWDTATAEANEHVQPVLKSLLTANLIFMYGSRYVHEEPEIRDAWQKAYDNAAEDAPIGRCLVSGERGPIARLHPSIKGVQGAQAMGASIVSFNAPAFESYGHDGEQGGNAPVSRRAAFAYGAALNYLISNRKNAMRFGDTTTVFWAEDGEEAYADAMRSFFGDSEETVSEETLREIMGKVSEGLSVSWKDIPLHPENRFYILGLAPNAARLSVRFFYQDTFGHFAKNIQCHQDELSVVRPSFEKYEMIPVWQLLRETVNPKASDKTPLPQMAGDVMRAVLTGARYPTTLYDQVQIRIRAEHDISRNKAAIIKAYLTRNAQKGKYEEVLRVKLNEETTYEPYVLGRLFALLEELQERANPSINTTIRDRYFTAACSTPALVFPTLINLAQAHLKKDNVNERYYDGEIGKLMAKIQGTYPKQLDIYDQGVFQLGYYHQKQNRYIKKEDK